MSAMIKSVLTIPRKEYDDFLLKKITDFMIIETQGGIVIPPVAMGVFVLLTLLGGGMWIISYQNSPQRDTNSQQVVSTTLNNQKLEKFKEKPKELELVQSTTSLETKDRESTQRGIDALDGISVQTSEKITEAKPNNTIIVQQVPHSPAPIPTPTPSPSQPLSTEAVVAAIKPGVVSIESRNGIGSGFLINDKKFVLTNAHVVKGVYKADVHLANGSAVTCYVVSRDEDVDLALLSIVAPASTKSLQFGRSDESVLKQGESVYAFGFPLGLKGDVSFKEGTISRRLSYNNRDYLEISNTILPGNSGGPLVNSRGEVVGVNTMVVGEAPVGSTIVGETIKLAIPANKALQASAQLTLRAHQLTSRNMSEIDDYERHVKELDRAIADYNYVMNEYTNFMNDPTMSTRYLELYDYEMHDVAGILITMLNNPPALSFISSINEAVHSFQKLIDDTRSIFLGEARQYLVARNANSLDTADKKELLDKQLEENKKMIDIFNNSYNNMVTASKSQLPY